MSEKHVIFLGAGASFSSGYPSANGLRLRLGGHAQLQADLKSPYTAIPDVFQTIQKCFEDSKASVGLFRHGGFGSVDEFSKLASQNYSKHVQAMKRLTRLVLSINNPEDNYHESDYYLFIQKLYDGNDLHSLKSHITILSYNYDCYLEYLLLKSQFHRYHLAHIGGPDTVLKNRLSSGFFKPADPNSLNSLSQFHNQHFRHFKLHGAIHYAEPHLHKQLFEDNISERIKPFSKSDFAVSTPPLVFPWELFDAKGEFVHHTQFPFTMQATNNDQNVEATILYNLYSSIWQGAREAVQQAEKISFVGISMHEFLKDGLQFLFKNKKGTIGFVVANNAKEPQLIGQRIASMLNTVAPKLSLRGSQIYAVYDKSNKVGHMPSKQGITHRDSFSDFIEKEMD